MREQFELRNLSRKFIASIVVVALVMLILAAFTAAYLNKVLMLTYELKSATFVEVSPEIGQSLLKQQFAKMAKKKGERFIVKRTPDYIGETLGTKNELRYQVVTFGYCGFDECVSVSNDFRPDQFQILYYDNWLVTGSGHEAFQKSIDQLAHRLDQSI
jgi:hypothetical protein